MEEATTPPALAELRAAVERKCEEDLRKVASEGTGDAEALLASLQGQRRQRQEDQHARDLDQEAERLLVAVRDARDAGAELLRFAARPPRGFLADLQGIVDLLADHRQLPRRLPRDPNHPDWGDDRGRHDRFTRRELIVREYDTDNFFGLGRRASTRELAVVSLYLDPQLGCEGRRQDMKTPWQVIEAEEDAISKARKRFVGR